VEQVEHPVPSVPPVPVDPEFLKFILYTVIQLITYIYTIRYGYIIIQPLENMFQSIYIPYY